MAKPGKFQDRGVYIGFETKNLGGMRCRPSKVEGSVYEALISNWAGDSALGVGGDLVMPFLDVMEWAELSDRDKALHASVSQYGYKTEGYIDPQAMREIRFETDMAFADPILRMRAVEELRIESIDSQNTYFEILSIFARKYGATIDNRELKYVSRSILQQLARENPEDVLRLTREITKAAAEHGEITPETLSARLDFYSSFAAPICSILDKDSKDRDIGYLSRQLGALEDLMDRLEEFREGTNIEISGFITNIQENADKFLDFAQKQASAIQLLIVDDRSYTHDDMFKELKKELYENRMHIAYALDGWEQHYVGWKKLQNDSQETKEDFIIKLFRVMPQPTREVEMVSIGYDMSGVGSRAGTVRMMHSWDSESEDLELKNRVEAGKFNKSALEVVNSDLRSKRQIERSAGRDDNKDY
ncbi:hypothetical protein [Curvivirga aplysinae]|uniref:hypothetical protein n=1 Tax=Curvivirga aplysinae TaxID=2529852 RepID=UPI0012BB6D1A|nr:hypothetical protein [Curvivirga aplysinae]MTI11219.1 hypothetical protein [Curvivirga aplysinae]